MEYEYTPGRYLRPGDKFRSSLGPYYVSDKGQVHRQATIGKFTFVDLVVDGAGNHILIARDGRGAQRTLIIHRNNPDASSGFVYRKYKISKVRK
jgi:hypothetical protein